MILETPKLISISFVAEEETVTLYASPTESSSGQKAKRELMLRPHFPGYFHESDLPDLSTISEVIVAVADVWRVGDLVDWFFSGCFWSGTITDIIDDKRAKVLLPAHLLKYFLSTSFMAQMVTSYRFDYNGYTMEYLVWSSI